MKLKQTSVKNKIYNYIQYENENTSKTSVEGLVIKVDQKTKDSLKESTGFYRQLMQPLQNNKETNQIVALTITSDGMAPLTGFYFISENMKAESVFTKEPHIVPFFHNYISQKGIKSELVNSLEFLNNCKDEIVLNLLNHYYNPISANDTGIHINGKVVHYGQKVIINNIPKMIEKFNMNNSKLHKLNVQKAHLTIFENGPKISASIGEGYLYDKQNNIVPCLKYYCIDEIENDYQGNYQKFAEDVKVNDLYSFAKHANDEINKRPNKKEKIIQEWVERFEKECTENDEAYLENFSVDFLLEAIKENIVELV